MPLVDLLVVLETLQFPLQQAVLVLHLSQDAPLALQQRLRLPEAAARLLQLPQPALAMLLQPGDLVAQRGALRLRRRAGLLQHGHLAAEARLGLVRLALHALARGRLRGVRAARHGRGPLQMMVVLPHALQPVHGCDGGCLLPVEPRSTRSFLFCLLRAPRLSLPFILCHLVLQQLHLPSTLLQCHLQLLYPVAQLDVLLHDLCVHFLSGLLHQTTGPGREAVPERPNAGASVAEHAELADVAHVADLPAGA
mmetsp:Transcript_116156/g.375321  ORF Transcript_116156/g.375321 Transcript_116156/m.375321 type:complete len:252 (-) Transcript_116156:84-839(-)